MLTVICESVLASMCTADRVCVNLCWFVHTWGATVCLCKHRVSCGLEFEHMPASSSVCTWKPIVSEQESLCTKGSVPVSDFVYVMSGCGGLPCEFVIVYNRVRTEL